MMNAAGDERPRSPMKIAITGVTGFLGRHVTRAFAGHDVELVLAARRVEGLEPPLGGSVVQLDVHAPPEGAFERLGRPDALLHLAWGGLPNYRSEHHVDVELPAQFRLLATLIREGLRSLVVTGTCFEYGMQSGELREDLETRPDNPYGVAKDALRQQLQRLRSELPFQLTWARLFYMYGEGQSPRSLYSLLQQALQDNAVSFPMSGGEQLRDFLPVETVADHLAAMALSGADLGVVNVCSGRPTTVRALVESWLEEAGSDLELELGRYPYPDYEPMAFWGSAGRLVAFRAGDPCSW